MKLPFVPLLFLISCHPSIQLHKDAALAQTAGGKLCYSVREPKEVVGRYCLEKIK